MKSRKEMTMATIKDRKEYSEKALARLRELRKYHTDEPLELIWEKCYKPYGMTYERFMEHLVSKEGENA